MIKNNAFFPGNCRRANAKAAKEAISSWNTTVAITTATVLKYKVKNGNLSLTIW
jgi:hypothetical protein